MLQHDLACLYSREGVWHNLQELRGGRLDHEHREMNETRETATADVYPAIACSAGVIASGRAEDIVYHAAAGETDVYRVKRPVW
jgi:hypothetical protein